MLRGSIRGIGGVYRRALRRGRATVSQTDLRWGRKKCAEGEKRRRRGGRRGRARRRGVDRRGARSRPDGIGKCSPIPDRRRRGRGPAWARTGADRVHDTRDRNMVLARAFRTPARKIARRHDGRRAAPRRADQIRRSQGCESRNRRGRSWARAGRRPRGPSRLASRGRSAFGGSIPSSRL